jgi:hypothetical protein
MITDSIMSTNSSTNVDQPNQLNYDDEANYVVPFVLFSTLYMMNKVKQKQSHDFMFMHGNTYL